MYLAVEYRMLVDPRSQLYGRRKKDIILALQLIDTFTPIVLHGPRLILSHSKWR